MNIISRHGVWRDCDYWYIACDPNPLIFYSPQLRIALQLNRRELPADVQALPDQILSRLSRAPVMPATPPASAFHLGIGLTRDCSLACTYCHADAGRHERAQWPILQSAIAYAVLRADATPDRVLSASFAVGGEPTLEWALFVKTVDALRASAVDLNAVFLSMTTNGYYGDEKRAFVIDNFDIVTVSLDGPPEIHNSQRPTRGGRCSYDVVADTVRAFVRSGKLRVAVRATVSDKAAAILPEIVRHFAAEFGPTVAMSFEPLIKIGRAEKDQNIASPDVALYTQKYLEARCVGRELGVNVTSSGASIDRLVTRFCGAMAIPSFAVCVDGAVTACHRDQDAVEYGYGFVTPTAINLNDNKRAALASLNEPLPECATCFAKWHCAGDCPDLRRINWSRCDFNRGVIYDDITRVLARSKGGERKCGMTTMSAAN